MVERDVDHGLRAPADDGLEGVGGLRVDVLARALVDVRGLRASGASDSSIVTRSLVVFRLEGRLAGLARTALLDEIDADRPVRVLAATALLVAATAGCSRTLRAKTAGIDDLELRALDPTQGAQVVVPLAYGLGEPLMYQLSR